MVFLEKFRQPYIQNKESNLLREQLFEYFIFEYFLNNFTKKRFKSTLAVYIVKKTRNRTATILTLIFKS